MSDSPRRPSRTRRRPVIVVVALLLVVGTAFSLVALRDDDSGAARPLGGLGFYTGYADAGAYRAWEHWLGRQGEYIVQYADSSASEFVSSVWGQVIARGGIQSLAGSTTLVESIPLAFGGSIDARTPDGQAAARDHLQATDDGRHDAIFRRAATYLRDGGFDDAVIRLGWEFDGNWFPWSAQGNCALWRSSYRRVHDIFTSVSPKFRFDWSATSSYLRAGAECAWPGDEYVDIVGLDYYDQGMPVAFDSTTGTWADPVGTFDDEVVPNLRYQLDFAIAHGKRVSYPEWALSAGSDLTTGGGDNPAFVQGMYEWMRTLPASGPGSLAYQAYFNEDGATDGNHALDNFPDARARYRALFGD
jgi:Glycosyl hydrolase family 26